MKDCSPGADEILLRQGGKWGYIRYHPDANGNVSFLLDNDGAVVEKYTYDVFGRPKITDAYGNPREMSHYDNRFLFQGREYIGEVGVYDYRNRFYHPELGRFLQKDPTGFDAGDMNLFRYCGDDPINGSDPTGLQDNIMADRIWEMAKYMDSANTLQGTLQEQMNRRDNAGVGSKSVSSENEGKKGKRSPQQRLKLASNWLAKHHKDLNPNHNKVTLVKLPADRDGQYHPFTGIKIDPHKVLSVAGFVETYAHELIHAKDGAFRFFYDKISGGAPQREGEIKARATEIREQFSRETGTQYIEPVTYDH